MIIVMDHRREYNKLLKSGMFFEFYPNLSGIWKKDRIEWIKGYKSNLSKK